MKLSTLAIAATIALSSTSAFAKKVVFKTVNNDFATQVCFTAATQGYDSAKTLVKENDINFSAYAESVTCNGLSIRKFAKTYRTTSTQVSKVEKIALVAKDANLESQLCLDAVVNGEQAARAKFNMYNKVLCNSQSLSVFVRKFKDQEVELRSSED
ncbi:MAG: DUF3718 domain-containing protein [Glaciecola sp.]|nr:DUF3718 domain-containing protein [Glaciecola sp.]MDG1816422.1 DUF3718 domain-containing protein [Glaciecola sp.]MDG2098463.1 DUF3718 domain-containing protein [Glaciecola sp.]